MEVKGLTEKIRNKLAWVKKNVGEVRTYIQGKAGRKKKADGDMKIPRDTGKKALRVFLWGTLALFCVMGIWTVIKPDPAATAKRLISKWNHQQSQAVHSEELMNFTNDFLKAYYSTEIDGKDEYLSTLRRYASEEVLENPVFDFKSESRVNYANAYRLEEIDKSQVNVYATVDRTVTEVKSEDKGMIRAEHEGSYTVKVPVYIKQGHYIVEDIPMIVADSGYKQVPADYEEKKITQQEMQDTAGLKAQINNFLKAYYGDDQSVINQYLPEGADTMDFKAVSAEGSYTFEGIDELKAYENTDGSILCLVSFQLRDEQTQTFMRQKFHMEVVRKKSKLYIKSMDTKTINLK